VTLEVLESGGGEPFLDSPVHCRVQPGGFISEPMQPSVVPPAVVPPAIRVAVVSEERMFREALTASLSAYDGLEVAALPGDRIAAAEEAGANVLLIDAAADPQSALLHAWEARERWPEIKLVALGLEGEDEHVVDFIEAGVQGWVLKGSSPDGLVEVIRAVHEGRTPCSPRVVASVLARIAALAGESTEPPPQSLEPLTLREREILALVADGLGNKEVGQRLRITVQTVKNHVHRILEKLQVHRRREAVRLAYDLALLAEPREIPPRSRRAGAGGGKGK
jgi:DNA-binding NarL/FixJ family response regulator